VTPLAGVMRLGAVIMRRGVLIMRRGVLIMRRGALIMGQRSAHHAHLTQIPKNLI